MLVTYRYLLRPTVGQYARLSELLEMQRQLYNAALEERIGAWQKSRTGITRLDQQKSLTKIRADDPEGYGALGINIGRWTLKRLDDAFAAFFKRAKKGGSAGFPRFRSKHRWRTFGLLEWSGARLSNGFLILKGMDRALRISLHRHLPNDAVIKGASLTLHDRRWFISLQIETTSICKPANNDLVVGIDVGIESLATIDDGTLSEHILNVRPRRSRQTQLRRAQRALSRCHRGSNRRQKVRRRLARLQERIANHRSTHLHQQSAAIAHRFSTICVEKLQIKNMIRSAAGTVAEPGSNVQQKTGLNEAVLDAGWGRFIQLLRYKAERAGGIVLDVNPRNTSQICSGCGMKVPKPLRQRAHSCASCGLDIHRDVNAARNIRAVGLAALAASRGVIVPEEPNVADYGVRAPGILLAASAALRDRTIMVRGNVASTSFPG